MIFENIRLCDGTCCAPVAAERTAYRKQSKAHRLYHWWMACALLRFNDAAFMWKGLQANIYLTKI